MLILNTLQKAAFLTKSILLRTNLILGGLLIFTSIANAFINIEAVRQIPGEGFVGSSGLVFNGQEGNTDKFSSKLTSLGILRFTENEYLLMGDYQYGTSADVRDTNKGQIHLRWTHLHREALSYEYFAQSEFDEFKDLNSRNLVGANLRHRLLQQESHFLYLGTGAFYEIEDFTSLENKEGFRGNIYLSYNYKVNDKVSTGATAYFQPLLKDLEEYRFRLQTGLDVRLHEKLSLDLDFNLTHDNGLPDNVKPTDSDYMAGFSLKY